MCSRIYGFLGWNLAVDPRAVLSCPVRKHSNVPPDMVSKDRGCWVSFFFFLCAIVSVCMFLLSVLGVLGRVFLLGFQEKGPSLV